MTKQVFILAHETARIRAVAAVANAPAGYHIQVKPPTRSLEMNAKFHAICGDLAKSGLHWAGKPRSLAQWKVLLVSGHAVATKEGSDVLPGLEGEFINLRESTALMSKARGSSLIEYALAFCASAGVELSEPQAVAA
jgi:hypothetical protein